jgi:hypothetical protein
LQQSEDDLEQLVRYSGIAVHWPEVWNTAGSVALSGSWQPSQTQGQVTLNDVGLSWQGGDFPVHGLNGQIAIKAKPGQAPEVATSWLSGRYGNGLLQVKAVSGPQQPFKLDAEGLATSLALQHFLTPARTDSKLHGDVPFQIQMTQASNTAASKNHDIRVEAACDMTELLASMQHLLALKQTTVTGPTNLAQTPQTTSQDATPEVPPTAPDLQPLTARLSALVNPQGLMIQPVVLHYGQQLLLQLTGGTSWQGKSTTPWNVTIPDTLDLATLGGVASGAASTTGGNGPSGHLAAQVTITPADENQPLGLLGWIKIADLHLPWLTMDHLSGEAHFTPELATLNLQDVQLNGVDLQSASAKSTAMSQYPIPLEDVQLQGRYLNVDSLVAFINEVMVTKLSQQLIEPVYRPWQVGDPVLPVAFRDAHVSVDEVIFRNIILEQLTGQLSLFANGYLELANAQLHMAGGQVNGRLALDPAFNQFLSLTLDAKQVKANALARALLGVSNEVFGDLTGLVSFTTQGVTDAEIAANTNGYTAIDIENGRLPALAKIETLLTAANLIRGGVLGFSLNNLARIVTPFKANYLARLTGSFQIAQGILYTDDLKSDGKNLDLLIQGNSRLLDGWSKYTITGQMSQDVSGQFGKIGQLSLRRFLTYVPVLGRIPTTQFGLLNIIPGFGYIPGFGGMAKDTNQFQAFLDGLPDDPAAFKSWKWVN